MAFSSTYPMASINDSGLNVAVDRPAVNPVRSWIPLPLDPNLETIHPHILFTHIKTINFHFTGGEC